jgi:beta-galactosidase
MASNVLGRPREDGRIASPADIRLWDMVSLAAGARGIFRLRWRPLLDGPLFGAFGAYGMDGSRTERSAMLEQVGRWIDSQHDLLESNPLQGDIGILIVPEAQLFSYAQQASSDFYAHATEGAYGGFFANNVQADWIRLEQLDDYDLVYMPFPISLEADTAERLKQWVDQGGTLISEGCPAYFGDNAHVGTVQPNLGLDELFGARESYVEFTPDLLEDLTLSVGGQDVRGGLFMQAYTPTTGTPVGTYEDGRVAAVEHRFGQGRTLLVGTFPGYGQWRHPEHGCRDYFAWLLRWANKTQHVTVSDPRITARLQEGPQGLSLWLTNPTTACIRTQVTLNASHPELAGAEALWGKEDINVAARDLNVLVNARNALVLRLEAAGS